MKPLYSSTIYVIYIYYISKQLQTHKVFSKSKKKLLNQEHMVSTRLATTWNSYIWSTSVFKNLSS